MKKITSILLAVTVLVTLFAFMTLTVSANADDGLLHTGYEEDIPEAFFTELGEEFYLYAMFKPIDFPRGGEWGYYFKDYIWDVDELAKGIENNPNWAVGNLPENEIPAAMEKLNNFDYTKVELYFDGLTTEMKSKVTFQPSIENPLDFSKGPIKFKLSLNSNPDTFIEFTCTFKKYPIVVEEPPSTGGDEEPIITTDPDTGIKLEADPGIVPDDTVIKAVPVTTGGNFTIINNALEQTSDKFVAYNISLISKGVEIQPNSKVKITMPRTMWQGLNMNKMV